MKNTAGFTIVEVLIASILSIAVIAGALAYYQGFFERGSKLLAKQEASLVDPMLGISSFRSDAETAVRVDGTCDQIVFDMAYVDEQNTSQPTRLYSDWKIYYKISPSHEACDGDGQDDSPTGCSLLRAEQKPPFVQDATITFHKVSQFAGISWRLQGCVDPACANLVYNCQGISFSGPTGTAQPNQLIGTGLGTTLLNSRLLVEIRHARQGSVGQRALPIVIDLRNIVGALSSMPSNVSVLRGALQ
jgi:hypothetical protein